MKENMNDVLNFYYIFLFCEKKEAATYFKFLKRNKIRKKTPKWL